MRNCGQDWGVQSHRVFWNFFITLLLRCGCRGMDDRNRWILTAWYHGVLVLICFQRPEMSSHSSQCATNKDDFK
jgi:hypothetical protein